MVRDIELRGGRPLMNFRGEMENLFDRFLTPIEEWSGANASFAPVTNVAESESEYEVTIELPGVKADEVQVEFHGGRLTVSGEKRSEHEEKGKNFRHVERRYGSFQRVIPLNGPVDDGKISATFTDGVLRVQVPKSEAARPKRIQVSS